MSLGDKIMEQREAAGLSRHALAVKAGISANHLRKIEQDKSVPSVIIMAKIARALGKGVEFFLEDIMSKEEEVDQRLRELLEKENIKVGAMDGILSIRDMNVKESLLTVLERLTGGKKEKPGGST
jgi:transcriptional regulator with XRE-family HTH domain